jgi:hypothetical protein
MNQIKLKNIFWWCIASEILAIAIILSLSGTNHTQPSGQVSEGQGAVVQVPSQIAATAPNSKKVTSHSISFNWVGHIDKSTGSIKKGNSIGNVKEARQSRMKNANVKKQSGIIPELTIDFGSMDLHQVAKTLGYKLIAVASGKIIGIFDGYDLTKMQKSELSKYSERARDANVLENAFDYKSRACNLTGISAGSIDLIYLVPLNVESDFVAKEMNAIQKHKLIPEQVSLVKGKYDRNCNLVITEIILSDSKSIMVD